MARQYLQATYDHPEIQEALDALYRAKEQAKALREEIKFREEQIQELFDATGEQSLVFDMGEEYIILTPDVKVTEKLNKDELAHEARLEKKELAKPYDISYWTKQGRLDPRMIQQCIEAETTPVIRRKKRKKPR